MSMDHISDLDIKPSAFKQMHNLRLLKLHFEHFCDPMSRVNKVHLPQGLECLPQALRIMQWDGYALNSLPSKFCAEKLVELRMCYSRLQRLWNKGLKINLGSLRHIDLSGSKHLADVSALIESPNLETINLWGCTSLVQLPSFQHLAKLNHLDLCNCFNLKILPEMPGSLETLYLHCTAIEELPSSIWCLEKLHGLGLIGCKELKNLPSSTCRLNSLRLLNLEGCLSLECLPVELPSGLTELYLGNCKSLGSLPVELPSGLKYLILSNCKSLGFLPVELPSGLKELILSNCKSLGSLPVELPSGLKELQLSDCMSLGSLPVELPSVLEKLYLSNCKSLGSLPKLPWLLKDLQADGCMSLERTAPVQGWDQYANRFKEFSTKRVKQHIFINCLKLDQSARNNIMADARLQVMRFAMLDVRGDIRIVCPGNEIPKWLRYQSEGCSINIKLPPHWHREGFLGYALCIVVAFNNYTPPDIGSSVFTCETHHKTNNCQQGGQALRVSLPDILNSDHVFVWYFRPESAINREDWVKASEASFDFMLYQSNYREKIHFDQSTVRVKKCGVSLLYAQDLENLFGGVDEDLVMEPKQVVEKEDIIIKTKRRRDLFEPCGSGTAIFKEEDDGELPPRSNKRKIHIF